MRFLMRITIPDDPFNDFVRNGSISDTMGKILGDIKPEAAYFVEMNGHRTGILIVNMNNTSEMPTLAEPWFLLFKADVEFHPAMMPEDLANAHLMELGKKWS